MTIELKANNQKVRIDTGELTSYVVEDHEYIHQKGSPGWRNSDTEMFPIIGPTSKADFKVSSPRGIAVQDQHGLLRELLYDLKGQTGTSVTFCKVYKAGTRVRNSKYPEKSAVKELHWPYDFTFEKAFELTASGLEIVFTISGEQDMPYMLGYHPAFKLYTENPKVHTEKRIISLTEIMAVGSRALQVADCDSILLEDKKKLSLKTEGFGNFMLWTEVPNMVCIEPITFYPYSLAQNSLHAGFGQLKSKEAKYKVSITTV